MKKFFSTLFLLFPIAILAAGNADELLEPEKAFALTVTARDATTIEATWKIADGYYMYRDKFKFESLDPAIILKSAVYPKGKKKSDPAFGTVETYTKSVTVTIPIERRGGASTAKLRITGQGCNEPIGVCYPPLTQEKSVPLKVASAKEPAGSGLRSLKDLAGLVEPSGSQEFLPPDEAFRLSTELKGDSVEARIRIAPGYYLYRDKTSMKLAQGTGVTLGKPEISRGKIKDDPTFGKMEVLYDELVATAPLRRKANAGDAMDIEIGYQGCADKGICYPAEKKKVSIALASGTSTSPPAILTAKTVPPKVEGESSLALILAAFGAGLLLTFTPCVLPMIPILSGVIIRSGDQRLSKAQAGLVSYSYVFGTAVTYTVAGILAGATGEQLQAYFQNPWAISIFAAILFLLALSMFGLYELQMPSSIQSKLHYHSHKIRGGSYMGAFFLGLVSALIVGACVSPVLIGVLGVAITKGDPVLGGSIMFAMAHGQGVALVGAGIGAGYLLPKAGHWMDRVKYVFGVMLVGVSIYLLGYLPHIPVLLLWSVLLIVTAVYMGATQSLPHDASGWRYLWKGLGTFFLIWGALALLGGLMGERDILKPVPLTNMARMAGGTAVAAPAGELFHRVADPAALDAALAKARADKKPVILDFFATWCTDCVRMEKTTFNDPRVRAALQRFDLIQADVTENDARSNAIKKKFGVFGPPAMLFFGPDGTEKKAMRFYGYRNADEFLALLSGI